MKNKKKGLLSFEKRSLENIIHQIQTRGKEKEVEARDDEDDDENNTGEHIARERNRS